MHLVDCAAAVEGAVPERSVGLAAWIGTSLDAWRREEVDAGVRFIGPQFDRRVGAAALLRLVLVPGGATEVQVFPLVRDRRVEMVQRRNRTFRIGLERDVAPDRPVRLFSRLFCSRMVL